MNRAWLTGVLGGLGAGAIVLVLTGVLGAQGAPPPTGRVACIDVGAVFAEYQRMKDINEELKGLQTKLETENQDRLKKTDALKNTVDLMDRDDPARVKKMGELLEAQVAHRTWFDVQEAHAKRELALATDRIYRDILRGAEEVAKQVGYDLVVYREPYPPDPPSVSMDDLQNIMRSRKVIFASPGIDITQLVLDKLNSEYRARPRVQELYVP